MPQNPMSGNAVELLNLSLQHCRKAPCTPFRRWLWCGFGVAVVWLSVGFGVALVEPWWSLGGALVEPWCGFVVALWWLCTPESMPSICLLYGFAVALGGSARPSGLAFASGVREMSESAKLPDSPPLASQSESRPEIWV